MAAGVFDALALRYDELWTHSTIGRLQRQAVWRRLDTLFRPGRQGSEFRFRSQRRRSSHRQHRTSALLKKRQRQAAEETITNILEPYQTLGRNTRV
jgi:hypothetical protein